MAFRIFITVVTVLSLAKTGTAAEIWPPGTFEDPEPSTSAGAKSIRERIPADAGGLLGIETDMFEDDIPANPGPEQPSTPAGKEIHDRIPEEN